MTSARRRPKATVLSLHGTEQGSGTQIRTWHSPSFSTAGADSLRETGFLGELEEFVACVRAGREPESSIRSAAETMRLYEAIVQAADTGKPVALDWSREDEP